MAPVAPRRKIIGAGKTKVIGNGKPKTGEPGGYTRHAVPYALIRTVGGQERGYVMVGPDFVYQVIPTSKGLIIERLDNDTAGTTNQRVTKTREYTINPRTLEIT
jgi:hypothetical protein